MYDYVWVPLVGRAVTLPRLWRANLVVMTLFGLWHGPSWTFVLWGLSYGVAISVQQSLRFARARAGRRRAAPARGPLARSLAAALGWALTMLAGSQLIMVFFSPDHSFAGRYLAAELDWTRAAPGAWAAGMLLALLCLLAVHAALGTLDLQALWRRIGPVGRLAFFLGGAWIAFVWRAPVVEPFVYFRF
jgi:D-alanyl-lipoteichoic acid acyltransferase DltB (MBOAT superfamily)